MMKKLCSLIATASKDKNGLRGSPEAVVVVLVSNQITGQDPPKEVSSTLSKMDLDPLPDFPGRIALSVHVPIVGTRLAIEG